MSTVQTARTQDEHSKTNEKECGESRTAIGTPVTPQPGGDVSTCQRGVTGCRGVSRDVTEMSRECRRNVAGCRGMSRDVAGMSRDVAGCRRSSTCHGNVAECRRCHGNVADVARMSPECRGNVAGCHRGVTECQLPSHLDQRVDMSTHPHQAGGFERSA